METNKEDQPDHRLVRNQTTKIIFFVILLTYLISRLMYLSRLPVFVDEAIYVRWIHQIFNGEGSSAWNLGRWLFVQVAAVFTLLPMDSVVAIRLLSVCSGVVTLVASAQIGTRLFNLQTGLTTAALYALVPYSLFYNRLGTPDGLSMAFGALAMLACIGLVRSPWSVFAPEGVSWQERTASLTCGCVLIASSFICNPWILSAVFSHDGSLEKSSQIAILISEVVLFGLGALLLRYRKSLRLSWILVRSIPLILPISASILSKVSAILLLPVPIVAAITLSKRGGRIDALVKALPSMIAGAALIGFMTVTSGGMYQFSQRASLPVSNRLSGTIWHNARPIGEWFWVMLTPPLAIALLCCLAWVVLKKRTGEHVFLVLVAAGTCVPYILTANYFNARYILFILLPTTLLLASFLVELAQQLYRWSSLFSWSGKIGSSQPMVVLCVLLLAILPIWQNIGIVLDPEQAKLPVDVQEEFISEWASGYGIRELGDYLKNRAANEPDGIDVFRNGYSLNVTLDLYVTSTPFLTFHEMDRKSDSAQSGHGLGSRPAILLLDRTSPIVPDVDLNHASRVWVYTRKGGGSNIEAWELPPDHPLLGS